MYIILYIRNNIQNRSRSFKIMITKTVKASNELTVRNRKKLL